MLSTRPTRGLAQRVALSRRVWRIDAKLGSRLTPRERGFRDRSPKLPPPKPRKVEAEVVGIKQLVDDADLGEDAETELTLLEGPLEGSFRSFSFHEGVDVYVPHNAEQQFNLAQCYLYDREAHVYARPKTSDVVPDAFLSYQALEWDTWISGDSMNDVAETTQLHRVYFIRQKPLRKGRSYAEVDFQALYCIDGASRTVEKSTVIDLTDERTVDPVLSILDGEIVIRDTRDCPTMEGYALVDEQRRLRAAREAAQAEMEDLALMEEYAESEEKIEEQPDVPESDQQ